MARELDSELAQKLPRQRSDRDAHRRLTRARTLENVTQIPPVIFLPANQIGVPRARSNHLAVTLRRLLRLLCRHDLEPVLEITILDHQRDRRSERLTVPNPGQYLHLIGLDLHSPTAPVTLLPAPELVIDIARIDRQTCR